MNAFGTYLVLFWTVLIKLAAREIDILRKFYDFVQFQKMRLIM